MNRDQYGRTPVHFAAACGHVTILECLLNSGGSPIALDNSGYTPIHWAAYNGMELVCLFIVGTFFFFVGHEKCLESLVEVCQLVKRV